MSPMAHCREVRTIRGDFGLEQRVPPNYIKIVPAPQGMQLNQAALLKLGIAPLTHLRFRL